MDFNNLVEIATSLVGIVGVALLFFFYFTKAKVRKVVDPVLKYLPFILDLLSRFVKDKENKFDTHEALELLASVSARVKETVEDITNKNFEDVEEEVFEIVRDELARYAGLPGVPSFDDPALKVQVKVVFEAIKRALLDVPVGVNVPR